MSSFQLPPQLQGLRNINVPPQLKSVQAKIEYYVAQVDKELSKYPALVKAEQVTHVPKAWGVIGLLFFTTTAIFFNIAATFLTNLIGVALPTYLSLRALESPGKDDDKQWVAYWVSYGFLTILESFSSILVYYIPSYYTFKTLFLLWLQLPQTQGAKVLFTKVYSPIFFHKKKVPAVPAA